MASGWGAVNTGAWSAPTENLDHQSVAPEDVAPQFKSKKSSSKRVPPQGNAFDASPSFAPPAPAYKEDSAWDNRAKESDLQRREAEVARKEKELRQLEGQLKQSGAVLKAKNWPKCYPMVHHDIRGDIPSHKQRTVWYGYACWWGLLFCLSFNLFGASVMLGYNGADKVSSWFLAVIYWLTGVPLSFILWYRTLYVSSQNESTFASCRFFVFFAMHLGFCIWAAIAVPFSAEKWSFTGFVAAMSAFDQGTFVGVVYIIGASFWVLEVLLSLWFMKEVYFGFRGRPNQLQGPAQV